MIHRARLGAARVSPRRRADHGCLSRKARGESATRWCASHMTITASGVTSTRLVQREMGDRVAELENEQRPGARLLSSNRSRCGGAVGPRRHELTDRSRGGSPQDAFPHHRARVSGATKVWQGEEFVSRAADQFADDEVTTRRSRRD